MVNSALSWNQARALPVPFPRPPYHDSLPSWMYRVKTFPVATLLGVLGLGSSSESVSDAGCAPLGASISSLGLGFSHWTVWKWLQRCSGFLRASTAGTAGWS